MSKQGTVPFKKRLVCRLGIHDEEIDEERRHPSAPYWYFLKCKYCGKQNEGHYHRFGCP